jgi:hypothetical protein
MTVNGQKADKLRFPLGADDYLAQAVDFRD